MRTPLSFFLAALLPALAAAQGPAPTITLDDALQRTLEASRGVQVQRQRVVQAEAGVLAAAGQFDWDAAFSYLHSLDRTPTMGAYPGGPPLKPLDFNALNNLLQLIGQQPLIPPADLPFYAVQRTDVNRVGTSMTKQLRNGVIVSPYVTVTDSRVNVLDFPPAVRSDVGLQFLVPLGRGYGRDAATASEQIAGLGLRATRAQARFEISERVSGMVVAFWDCMAAEQRLELLRDTEKRAQGIVAIVDRMVRSGESESAVLGEANAEALRRRGDRLDGEYELYSARQRLGLALGLTAGELSASPLPAGTFPPAASEVSEVDSLALAKHAMEGRGDLEATAHTRRIGEVSVRKARNDLRPRFDLDMRVGYAGGAEGYSLTSFGNSLSHNTSGVNLSTGLSLEWPTANRAARGALLRRSAELRETELDEAELSARIAAEVGTACEALRRAVQQRAIAEQTVEALAQVVANQRQKLDNGETNLTALVQNEDRYFQARTAFIAAARNHAVALIELRRVTGTLVRDDRAGYRLPLASLTTAPSAAE